MTLYNVRALENDDFKRLPSDTFTRGYLRIYAKLLKLDVESLVAAYEQTRRDAGLDPEPVDIVELNRRKPNSGRPLWYFIASIVVVLVLLWILSVWFLGNDGDTRSEEHTSELQSRGQLVCRLLLEKKNKQNK